MIPYHHMDHGTKACTLRIITETQKYWEGKGCEHTKEETHNECENDIPLRTVQYECLWIIMISTKESYLAGSERINHPRMCGRRTALLVENGCLEENGCPAQTNMCVNSGHFGGIFSVNSCVLFVFHFFQIQFLIMFTLKYTKTTLKRHCFRVHFLKTVF